MMKFARLVILVILALGIASASLAAADKYSGTPAARAQFKKGKAAGDANDWKKAVTAFKKAIKLDPNFADAHEQYMWANMRLALGDLDKLSTMSADDTKKLEVRVKQDQAAVIKEYEELVHQHPDMPIYLWALAQNYDETNPELQEKYCKQAIDLDPAFTPGFECIAAVASLRGDWRTAAQSYRKVIELSPDKPELWLRLQRVVRTDPQEYKATTTEIVNKLPDSDTAVQALFAYAETLPESEEIAALEEILAKYPVKKFHAASEAAESLFGFYDRTDPPKADVFAHKLLGDLPEDKDWKEKVNYADAMAAAETKVKANDSEGALAVLKDIKTPGYVFDKTRLQLLKAKAQDIAGKTSDAYSDLLKIFAAEPVRLVQSALYEYGRKLGKSTAVVDEEVWSQRVANAKPAIPFSLESFLDGKKLSLDDFKGKVVMLDFWYPNCGPCMRSMPFLEQLYAKYKDAGVVFLGVNGMEDQAAFVLPLYKSRGWNFIPLKGDEKWCSDVYKVKGYPTTFLIGADGKVYFKPHVYNQDKYAIGEMQIEALLAAVGSGKKSEVSK